MKTFLYLIATVLLSLAMACNSGQKNTANEQQEQPAGTTANAGNQNASASLSTQDKEFVDFANQANRSEVDLGKYVADNSKNKDVKDFAKNMQDDHTKANDTLKDLAGKKNVDLTDETLPEAAQLKQQLGNQKGSPKFDKSYIEAEVKDHRTVINKFQAEAQNGQDPDVKAYAQQTVSTLQDHLKRAESVAKKLGVKVPPPQKMTAPKPGESKQPQ